MHDIMIALKNMGCHVEVRTAYCPSPDKEWYCEIKWKNEDGDTAEFIRYGGTPDEALKTARMAFERIASRGLPISQIVDHSPRVGEV